MLPNVMAGPRVGPASAWLTLGGRHVSSPRGDRAAPAGAPAPDPRAVGRSSSPAYAALAAARHASLADRLRAGHRRQRRGTDRLGPHPHPAARRAPRAVRRATGRRRRLHRGHAAARPAVRGVAGPAVRLVAADRAAAPDALRAARAVRHRPGALPAGPPDP